MNPQNKYFSYIRVSTVRQGQTGTSLDEQRQAIERHSDKFGFEIIREFEEQETAAKRGRPVFSTLINELKKGKARGVVMHKIDRSARNLRDWALLSELIDNGLDVQFANENIDMDSRGGRLSADIQAVVAADYIRNLREEVKKGIYGRLKQGYYPMPAPVGYLDMGEAEKKKIDPVKASMIKRLFRLYATGNYSIRRLADVMNEAGFRGKTGKKVTKTGIANILHNPFYAGVIRIKKNRKIFEGNHLPIVSRTQFKKVQDILNGKAVSNGSNPLLSEEFLFRRFLSCAVCKTTLIGEKQKKYRYYRCHTKNCGQKSIRQNLIDKRLSETIQKLTFTKDEMEYFEGWFEDKNRNLKRDIEATKKQQKMELQQLNERLSRLTDGFIDGVIEKEIYLHKKQSFLIKEKEVKKRLSKIEATQAKELQKIKKYLELLNSAYISYKSENYEKRRELIKILTSNFFVKGRTVEIKLNLPFEMIKNRPDVLTGGAKRDTPRTLNKIFERLFEHFNTKGTPSIGNLDLP